MSVTHVARLARGSQEFESNREEIKNKNSEEYNVLRFTLEGLIEELERHFDSAHANYMATTEQRTQDFKSLTIKDQASARTIESQMRRLQRLQDSMCHWKTKMTSNAEKCEERCVIQGASNLRSAVGLHTLLTGARSHPGRTATAPCARRRTRFSVTSRSSRDG